MKQGACHVLFLTFLGLGGPHASAHFNMLLLDSASARRGQSVGVTYQWGHPFEHQLFDAPAPTSLVALAPNGKTIDLGPSLKETTVKGTDKNHTAYRLSFTAEQRGDYILVLQTPPIWMEEDQEFLQDTVKVVLHVQAQKGWDAATGQDFEMVPLTRPYGLEPGMVFQAQVLVQQRPSAGNLVEVERYNAVPPKELPADEQITRTVKCDPNGVVTGTLTQSGWWCLTAQRDAGPRDHKGKPYPTRQRTSLWVFVDAMGASPASK